MKPPTPEGTEQAGLPAPSLGPPGPMTPLGMLAPAAMPSEMEVEEAVEPSAKRQKFSALRVGDETLFHMDVETGEYMEELGDSAVEFSCELDASDEMVDLEETTAHELTEDDLWQPFSQFEPELPSERLQVIDDFADKVEIQRLFGMSVLCKHGDYTGKLGTQLSAKFVRTWRKKTRLQHDVDGHVVSSQQGWLRRSRLVAREYNWLDVRDDVYSPSSSAAIVKLLPALCMSESFCETSVLGTLDIGDAFLQVPQLVPRVVRLGSDDYVILRCLPGQRDASKLWYQFFVEKLQKLFGATVCKEQPCVLKVERKVAMVMHVDDILFLGEQSWINNVFLPGLEKEFRLTSTVVDRTTGGSFEFLKRLHVVEANYEKLTVFSESKHVHTLWERFEKVNGKAAKMSKTPCSVTPNGSSSETAELLSEGMAAEFRSLVGVAMYISQQRFDVQFSVKTLASSLKQPTMSSWRELGKLIGYLKQSENYALEMNKVVKGSSFLETLNGACNNDEQRPNCLETFSDADWSGSGNQRSTSSAVHVLNGQIVHSSSRTQKCVSLSSTESEWYAASSGTCDGLYLHHILSFLCDGDISPLVLHTDNSAVRMLSVKLGAGRLRHIKGRLLWLQDKVASGDLQIKQVKTALNIADLNTKPLSRDRYFCLLYMFNFSVDGERVGETEYARMQTKELLKQQVRIVSEVVVESGHATQTTKLHKFAKQILRVLASCSLMSLAEGQSDSGMVKEVSSFGMDTAEALGHGLWLSPITLALFVAMFILLGVLVVLMVPGEREPEPEDGERDAEREPAMEPLTSRYPMNNRSLGHVFANVFADPMFKVEGMLVWMYHRCEGRVRRGNKRVLNGFRMETLQQMIKVCYDLAGMTASESQNMMDNVVAMTDLSDDDHSPRAHLSMDEKQVEIQQAYQAFQVGLDLVRQMRQAEARHRENADGETNNEEANNEQMDQSSSGSEGLPVRLRRYLHISLDEASDPDLWMEIHHGNDDEMENED